MENPPYITACDCSNESNINSDGADINADRLTIDHKPDSPEELRRIERHGGQVLNKVGPKYRRSRKKN